MRSVFVILIGLVLLCAPVFGSIREEALVLKSWVSAPFSSSALEAERDALIAQQSNLVKGEFETTAQFEQRKKDATARIAAIRAEYEQKIRDARSAHEVQSNRMRQRMQTLLAQSRETVERSFTLGAYDADSQKYKLTVEGRTVEVIVPLAAAPQVKTEVNKYKLSVTRQLDEDLQYVILEARLSGPAGTFASTGTAPGISAPATVGIIPPDLRALIAFSEPSGNNMLDADEAAQVKITVENSGKGGAFMVEARLVLSGVNGITFPATVYIGEVKAGQKAERTAELRGGQNITTGEAMLQITFSEQNGFQPDEINLRFPTQALLPPELAVADVGIVDANRDGVITPGEAVEVKVRIQNRGRGTSRKTVAEVVLGADVFLYGASMQREFTLGDLQPGQYKDIEFNIVTNKNAQTLNLSVNLREERGQFSRLAQPLNLAFNRRERTADQMVITGIDQWAQITDAPALSIDIEQDIPTFGKAEKHRYGIIIGIERYQRVSPVRFARRDAQFVQEYFVNVLGIPVNNIYTVHDEKATLGEMRKIFDAKGWLQSNVRDKNAELYVFYAGHGAPATDGSKAFLIPYDGDPNYPAQTGYELETLYANLGALPAKRVHVFLDACFSGADRDNEILLAGARPPTLRVAQPTADAKLNVFSASSGAQVSSAYPDMQHGLFSYFLMKGMRGEADLNGDKRISIAEMEQYLQDNVPYIARRMGREQDPQVNSADKQGILIQMK